MTNTVTLTRPTPVYRTARAASRGRCGGRPTLTPGTYPVRDVAVGALRTTAGWITT